MTSERIKTLRETRGWTQAELARRLNITRNGVNSVGAGVVYAVSSVSGGLSKTVFRFDRLFAGDRTLGNRQCDGLKG